MSYMPNEGLPAAVLEEFKRLAVHLRNIDAESVQLAQHNAAPAKYQDGTVVYADGTNWDPGSGEGAYIYYAAAWNYLG